MAENANDRTSQLLFSFPFALIGLLLLFTFGQRLLLPLTPFCKSLIVRDVESSPLLRLCLQWGLNSWVCFFFFLVYTFIFDLDNSRVIRFTANFISNVVNCILPVIELRFIDLDFFFLRFELCDHLFLHFVLRVWLFLLNVLLHNFLHLLWLAISLDNRLFRLFLFAIAVSSSRQNSCRNQCFSPRLSLLPLF